MSWTAASASYWAIAAVPINPAYPGPTHDLTMEVGAGGGGTVESDRDAPLRRGHGGGHHGHAGARLDVHRLDRRRGGRSERAASTTVTMDADKTVTANFTQDEYTLTVNTAGDGSGRQESRPDDLPLRRDGRADRDGRRRLDVHRLERRPERQRRPGDGDHERRQDGHGHLRGVRAEATSWTAPSPAAPGPPTPPASASRTPPAPASDRLLLVGVSWNCGSAEPQHLLGDVRRQRHDCQVITQKAGTTTSSRATPPSTRCVNPTSGASGQVVVTFSGAVSNGIVAGAANFAGVDQTTPLGTPNGAGVDEQRRIQAVTLTGLSGNELVFDNVFQGGSGSTQTLTAGGGQTGALERLRRPTPGPRRAPKRPAPARSR